MFRNLLFRIRAAILFARVHPYIEHAPDWTAEDTKTLSGFFLTPTGARYRRTLFHHVQACSFRATLERNHAQYECGYASGARGLAAVSDSLLVLRVEEPEETPADEQGIDLEALRP